MNGRPARRTLRQRVRSVVRHVRAQYRFLVLLVREFGTTLVGFVLLITAGGFVLSHHYTVPGRPAPLSYIEGMWAAFTLLFFQPAYPFPTVWYLQLLFFSVPVIGLALLAEGVVRFFSMVINHETRLEDWHMCLASTYSDHIVLCGLGRIGFRVLEQLKRTQEEVVVIEKDGENPFVKDARALGVPVVVADPTREAVLESVSVKKARTIIIATDDDLANLEIALDARDLNPDIRVVLRMFNETLVAKVKKAFNIQVAFSTSALAGPVFASASVSKAIRQSFYVDEQLLEVAEYRILERSRLAGKTLDDLKQKHQLRAISLRRGKDSLLFPPGTEKLGVGDVVVFLTNLETVKTLEEENGGV
jgi:voltage-gated potassium channel